MSITEQERTEVQLPEVLDPRVRRGAALLDEQMPGWADRVNLDELRLSSRCDCILGLLCGGYTKGLEALSVTWRDAADCGFDLLGRDRAEFPALEQDWRLAVLSRRAA